MNNHIPSPRGHSSYTSPLLRTQQVHSPSPRVTNQYHESLPRGVAGSSSLPRGAVGSPSYYTSPPRRTMSGFVNGISSSPPVRDRGLPSRGSSSASGSSIPRVPSSSLPTTHRWERIAVLQGSILLKLSTEAHLLVWTVSFSSYRCQIYICTDTFCENMHCFLVMIMVLCI